MSEKSAVTPHIRGSCCVLVQLNPGGKKTLIYGLQNAVCHCKEKSNDLKRKKKAFDLLLDTTEGILCAKRASRGSTRM